MKKFLKFFLQVGFCLTVLGVVFVFRFQLANFWQQILADYFPCRQPIVYSLGAFDNRFGLAQKDFLSAIVAAEEIWEKPANKDLFAYTENGALKINLVYDIRQESTDKLKQLGITVKDDKSSYDNLRTKYDSLKREYVKDKASLTAKISALQVRKINYESKVSYFNSHGGARKDEYEALEKERVALNAEIDEINRLQDNLNAKVDEINALAVTLNRLASSLNLTVDKYNQIGGQLGGEFEEGAYQIDANGQKIDIYQFDNRTKLIRVLAHELGHALGLEHVEDPKAIMYRLNNGINEKTTASDLAALKIKCHLK